MHATFNLTKHFFDALYLIILKQLNTHLNIKNNSDILKLFFFLQFCCLFCLVSQEPVMHNISVIILILLHFDIQDPKSTYNQLTIVVLTVCVAFIGRVLCFCHVPAAGGRMCVRPSPYLHYRVQTLQQTIH